MNMNEWARGLMEAGKRPVFPLMFFPGLEITGLGLRETLMDPVKQADCVSALAREFSSSALVCAMDLSVEAEAFGAKVVFQDDEVPSVTGKTVNSAEDAMELKIPEPGSARTAISLKAASVLSERIKDRPVFGCVCGPASLAGRLCDITSFLLNTRRNPELLHAVLVKCVRFLVNYSAALKNTGLNGIIIAEPVAGLLSPDGCESFSSVYVREIVDAVQDESFAVILHNCGNTVKQVPSMLSTGAMGYHFGNAVDMKNIMPQLPADVLAFGNIDPAGIIKSGSPAEVRDAVLGLMHEMAAYRNFVMSSGCDIPPGTPLANIRAFLEAVDEYGSDCK